MRVSVVLCLPAERPRCRSDQSTRKGRTNDGNQWMGNVNQHSFYHTGLHFFRYVLFSSEEILKCLLDLNLGELAKGK